MHKILQLLILIILIILLVSCKNTTTPQKKKVELSLSKTLGNVTQDFFYSINSTSDGNYIVAGSISLSNENILKTYNENEGWIVKIDRDGNKIWSESFGGENDDRFKSIIETNDGNYIAAGNTDSTNGDISHNNGGKDGWIVKIDQKGEKIWSKSFGGKGNDGFDNIIKTSDNCYLAIGYTVSDYKKTSNDRYESYGWVVKIDQNGDKIWSKSFSGNDFDGFHNAIETEDGYIINGSVSCDEKGILSTNRLKTFDGWLVKIDKSGNELWSKSFGENYDDGFYSIIKTNDNNYMAVGYRSLENGDVLDNYHQSDGWILKFDQSGNEIWSKSFGGSEDEVFFNIIKNSEDNYVLTGYTLSENGDIPGNHGEFDGWILSIDDNGNKIWSKTFGGKSDEMLYDIKQNNYGEYLAVGHTYSNDGDISFSNGSRDGWIIKLK